MILVNPQEGEVVLYSRVAEISFISLRAKVRISVIQEGLGAELLLPHSERIQRWLRHLTRMPPGHLLGEVFQACPAGRRPRGRPRTHWRSYISELAWECFSVPSEELEEVDREWKVLCLDCCHCNQTQISSRKWMNGWSLLFNVRVS